MRVQHFPLREPLFPPGVKVGSPLAVEAGVDPPSFGPAQSLLLAPCIPARPAVGVAGDAGSALR